MSSRSGRSLVELLVALTIVTLGGSLSVRVLTEATRELEGTELGLRAMMLLSQEHEGHAFLPSEIQVGSGRLVFEREGPIAARVRFEPSRGSEASNTGPLGLSGGFRRAREWRLEYPLPIEAR